ncbi:Arsenate reductase, glutaredoxin family [Enterocloster clostridioformis]|nr:Arsenate reductase, glutaredoxin family [Enterocloster clostridioformis]
METGNGRQRSWKVCYLFLLMTDKTFLSLYFNQNSFFNERGIKYQFIDIKEKGMSKGEFTSVAQANGGIANMINWEGKDQDTLALIKYIADEDKLEKILENTQILKTPVVINGKKSTLGYQPDVWKGWS